MFSRPLNFCSLNDLSSLNYLNGPNDLNSIITDPDDLIIPSTKMTNNNLEIKTTGQINICLVDFILIKINYRIFAISYISLNF